MCREAGGNKCAGSGHGLGVVVDGLPLFGVCQLVDTTLVFALQCDGPTWCCCGRRRSGVALQSARRRERTTLNWWAHVPAQGWWCSPWKWETAILQKRAGQAWRMRWGAMLSCAAAKAVGRRSWPFVAHTVLLGHAGLARERFWTVSGRIGRSRIGRSRVSSPPVGCSEAGVLGRRGFPLERAAAQVCREAGGKVTSNDGRRLEVVDGLTLWNGSRLAIAHWSTHGVEKRPRT